MVKKKSWWPWWFPYPSAWIGSLIQVALASGSMYLIEKISPAMLRIVINNDRVGPLILSFLICSALPYLGLAYIHHFLVGDEDIDWPRWMPCPKSIWVAFYSYNVFVLSFVILMGVIGTFLKVETLNIQVESDLVNPAWAFFWVGTMAYLYQIEHIVRNKAIEVRAKKLVKPTELKKNLDDGTIELNRLRAETGLTKMKPIRKK